VVVNRFGALLPSWPEVRAAVRRLWVPGNPPPAQRPEPPDEDLVDLLSDPFESTGDALDRLATAELRLRSLDDRRAVFLTVYTRMTEQVQAEIDSGGFENPAWIADYLVSFANAYRRAFVAYERGDYDAVPAPWRVAFDASLTGDTLVLQDALLGVNAHINYDLAYTLDEVGIDPDRETRHTDHDHVDAILADLIDVVQETLVDVYDAIGVPSADAILGDLDEQGMLLGLTEGRAFAWANAVVLADIPAPFTRRFVDWRLRTVSLGVAQLVRSASLDEYTRSQIRSLEQDSNAASTVATQLDATISRPTTVGSGPSVPDADS